MAGTKLHSFVFYIIHSNEKLKLRRNVLVVQYLYNKTYWWDLYMHVGLTYMNFTNMFYYVNIVHFYILCKTHFSRPILILYMVGLTWISQKYFIFQILYTIIYIVQNSIFNTYSYPLVMGSNNLTSSPKTL